MAAQGSSNFGLTKDSQINDPSSPTVEPVENDQTIDPITNPVPRKSTALVIGMGLFDALKTGVVLALITIYLKPIYDNVRALWPYSERLWFTFTSSIVHQIMYYGFTGLFVLFERYHIFDQYKLARTEIQKPTRNLIIKTLKQSFPGLWITQPIALYFLFLAFKPFQDPTLAEDQVPSFRVLVGQYAGSVLILDFVFYWTHRTLHLPWFYKRFHKQHHEYKGPIGIAAEYAHNFEQIFSNQSSAVLGPLLLGMNTWTWIVYLFWRLWRTYEVHSGYAFVNTWLSKLRFTFAEDAEFHDYHHTRNIGNFGSSSSFWDHLFCTDVYYYNHRKTKAA